MSTVHHTPHPFLNAVDSAQFNSRLGQLDAAIETVIAAGLVGASTTLTAQALSGQPDLVVASIDEYQVGDSVWVGTPGSGLQESGTVASIASLTITLTANLANTHAVGTPVSRSPVEIVEARGTFATLGARLGPIEERYFDVKGRFGAVGDGVADDTSAIQNAITAAQAAGGGTVFLPSGTYDLAIAGVALPANVTLRGAGPDTVLLAEGNFAAVTATSVSKVAVRDLMVQGSANAANTSNLAVQFSGVTDGLIQNVRAEDCHRSLRVMSTSSRIRISHCTVIDDTTSAAGAAIDVTSTTDVTIEGCSVVTPGRHGISFGSTAGATVVRGRIIGNDVSAAVNTGILLGGSVTDCVVSNNTATGGGWGILVERSSTRITVSDNIILNPSTDGILLAQGVDSAVTNCVVSGNVIRNAGQHGIFATGANYLVVANNRITLFGGDGIRITTSSSLGNVVSGNLVTDGSSATGRAISIACERCTVSGNVVRNTTGYGIIIDAIRCSVTGNNVTDADSGGTLTIGGITLTTNASRTVVSGNTSSRSTGTKQDYGVEVQAGCTNALVIGNILFQNTTGGVLDNGTGTVSVNNVTT